jgi:WD40 repeat protein
VWGLIFLPEAGQLLTGAGDALRFWQLDQPGVSTAVPLQLGVRSMALSADRKTLAVCQSAWNVPQGLISLREPQTGEVKRQLPRLSTSLSRIALSPDGELLAAAQFFGGVRLYSTQTATEKGRFDAKLPIGEGVTFSPDGKLLCVYGGTTDRKAKQAQRGIRIYRISDGAEVWRSTIMDDCLNAAFSPDGTLLGATDGEQNVYLWKLARDL